MDVSFPVLASMFGLIAFAGLMVWAGIGDVATFLITNKLNLLIAGTFLVLAIPMGLGWSSIFDHLKIGMLAMVIAFGMFMAGIYGGGDAKMTGAVALWLGPAPMIPVIFYTALAGGLLALVLIISRRVAKHYGLPRSPKWARRLLRRRTGAPYGVALGIGALVAVPKALWFPSTILG